MLARRAQNGIKASAKRANQIALAGLQPFAGTPSARAMRKIQYGISLENRLKYWECDVWP
jgi:hypothetical protein